MYIENSSAGADPRALAKMYVKVGPLLVLHPSFEVFVNNTNLTFLAFLYKISIEVS